MTIGYCFRCKEKVEVLELEYVRQNLKNKMFMYRGKCPRCGRKVGAMLKEKL